jgi:hypothetical protein
MSYTIDVRREDGVFISRFSAQGLHGETFEQYIQAVIDLNIMFDQDGRTQVYHILMLGESQFQFDFATMFSSLSTIRQNKTMVELRNRLNSMAILVTSSSATTQFIETMLSNASYGGRRMTLFPTLDKALEFVRFDQTNPSDSTDQG